MAWRYIARIGKVWQKKSTGKIYSNQLEISDQDDIKNYIQVDEPKVVHEETNKSNYFFNDTEETKWQ